MYSVKDALVEATKRIKDISDIPNKEARILLAFYLKKDQLWIITHDNEFIEDDSNTIPRIEIPRDGEDFVEDDINELPEIETPSEDEEFVEDDITSLPEIDSQSSAVVNPQNDTKSSEDSEALLNAAMAALDDELDFVEDDMDSLPDVS